MSSPAANDTAVRTALWRALHVLVDAPPHVFDDEIGLELAAPDVTWRQRPDMDPDGTRLFRASMVARARFVEDLIAEQAEQGVDQVVLLGAGLDTLALRRPDLGATVQIYEVDQPGHIAWKRRRLAEIDRSVPAGLHLVPVDFEAGGSWRDEVAAVGFEAGRPAVVSSAGVAMYLSRPANLAALQEVAGLAPGSILVTTFTLPGDLLHPDLREGMARAEAGARANGTPFISFFSPDEMLDLAREAGFADVRHVSADDLAERYFADRTDGLRTVSGEELLVART